MYILLIVIMLASWLVGWRFKSKFQTYSEEPLASGLSGAEIAQRMLNDHGIYDVKIITTEGQLTDHYNPNEKTVNLSHEVFYGRSVASAAVAAHEVGHAVQHAKAYAWLTMRSSLVPAVSVASKWMPWILIGGVLTLSVFPFLLLAGIVLFAITTVFSFITLPVEFDASNRALAWMNNKNVMYGRQSDQAKDALNWAAMTYVVAALSSLATLVYYIMIFMNRRD